MYSWLSRPGELSYILSVRFEEMTRNPDTLPEVNLESAEQIDSKVAVFPEESLVILSMSLNPSQPHKHA